MFCRRKVAQMRMKFVQVNINRLTYADMAVGLGISISSITKYVQKLKKENMLPKEHIGRIRTAAARNNFELTGDDSADIVRFMDTYKKSEGTARKWVHEMTGRSLRDDEVTKGRRIKVASLHKVGLSVVDIAKRLAVAPSLVRADLIVLGMLSSINADDLGERIHDLIMRGYSIKSASAECDVSLNKGWMAYKTLRLEKPTIDEEFRKLHTVTESGRVTTRKKKRLSATDLKVSNTLDQHTSAEIADKLGLSEKLVKASLKKLLYHNIAVYDSEKQVYRTIEPAVIKTFTDTVENNGIRKNCNRLGVSITRYRSIVRRHLLDGRINIKETFGKLDRDSIIIKLNEVCGDNTISTIMGVDTPTVRRVIRSRKNKYISLKGDSNEKK
jgi:DNA-binding CsgD family transcriptional regulator